MRGGYHPIGYIWQQFNAKPVRGRPRIYATPEERRQASIDASRRHREAKRRGYIPKGPPHPTAPPPPEVQHEYIAAVMQPRSITAELFGDPLPGRSALDRKMRRIHEPA